MKKAAKGQPKKKVSKSSSKPVNKKGMSSPKEALYKKEDLNYDLKVEEELEEEDLYPSEEQGILPDDDKDTIKSKIRTGNRDEDIYSAAGREELEEDDEVNPWEEGFMEGASGAGQLAKDALTGEPLMGIADVVEVEIDGKMYRFVNEENAQKFRKKHEDEEEDID
ncbi:MAG: hypothetical protein Q8R37_00900 [Nanoarchaeota archaeon]|nr:hypothetical protein [Nanoarchaeota archaeon]